MTWWRGLIQEGAYSEYIDKNVMPYLWGGLNQKITVGYENKAKFGYFSPFVISI